MESDIWSLGVLLHVLITGVYPYSGKNVTAIFKSIAEDPEVSFQHKDIKNISQPAKELLQLLLKKDPMERITAQEALKHPWF